MSNIIPPMTEPLGKYWRQPSLNDILIDDTHALMGASAFSQLPEYSATTPSGVYPGKMWKAEARGKWFLRWFGIVDDNPNVCSNNGREILIVDEVPA